MTNPKQEWDGFADPHWNLGQVILWIATGDRDYVDKASDRGGSPGESYWLAPAAVLINEQIPSADVRRKLVEQIRQEADANVCNKADANFRKRIAELIGQICQEPDPSERQKLAEQMCQEAEANARQRLVEQAFAGVRKEIAEQIYQPALAGQLKSFDCSSTLPKELPPFNWINLTIDFDSAIPFVWWRNESSCAFEHTALRFLKKDVLKCFPATAPQRRGRKSKYKLTDVRKLCWPMAALALRCQNR